MMGLVSNKKDTREHVLSPRRSTLANVSIQWTREPSPATESTETLTLDFSYEKINSYC
jgi:hypothetical protein